MVRAWQHPFEARDRSPHWLMRETIAQYVVREEKRRPFGRMVWARGKPNQETGLHLIHAEWMHGSQGWLTETTRNRLRTASESPEALADVQRFYRFLAEKNRDVARAAAQTIQEVMQIIAEHPEIGRPAEDMDQELRE